MVFVAQMPSTKSRQERNRQRQLALQAAADATVKPLKLRGGEITSIEDSFYPTFESMGLDPALIKGTKAMGFHEPTNIQRGCISQLIQGKDVIASALTGSGKTAAFVLPMLQQLINIKKKNANFPATRALILSPTRELAAQITKNIRDLSQFVSPDLNVDIKVGTVYGGASDKPQLAFFKKKVDILVACPGRLLDMMKKYKRCRLKFVRFLVLDEADKMLDMGFIDDVKRVVEHLDGKSDDGHGKAGSNTKAKRQASLFAATIGRVEELCSLIVSDQAITVQLQSKYKPKLPANMTHHLCRLPDPWDSKLKFLIKYIRHKDMEVGSAVVFVQEKANCEKVCTYIKKEGITADYLHSDRTQAQRDAAMMGFKNGDYRVIVATNVISRGIDVPALTHVFNFDVPTTPEDYVHRVGRTARADRSGHAVTLMSGSEKEALEDIECAIGFKLPLTKIQDYRTKNHKDRKKEKETS